MNSSPHYYSRLAPFQAVFATGYPILTYHHVGPRQPGARLKGLYVSPQLFGRQLKELEAAGYRSGVPGSTPTGAQAREVALTFDDGFLDVLRHGLPVLQQQGFVGTQFLVAGLIGQTNVWQQRVGDVIEPLMDEGQVREWLAAGQRIGSHTLSHPRLTQLPPAMAREEISASKKSLEDRFGVPVQDFCYPYGDWNARLRDLVEEAGYRTACTTVSGVNLTGADPFALKRFTARYPSRNLKAVKRWLGAVFSWVFGSR